MSLVGSFGFSRKQIAALASLRPGPGALPCCEVVPFLLLKDRRRIQRVISALQKHHKILLELVSKSLGLLNPSQSEVVPRV